MIPAGNVTDVHAQDFVVNEKLLLPILKMFAQCNDHSPLLKVLDVFSV
jgi:hypothetical protein